MIDFEHDKVKYVKLNDLIKQFISKILFHVFLFKQYCIEIESGIKG